VRQLFPLRGKQQLTHLPHDASSPLARQSRVSSKS
jgi:hypothetical protein